MLTFTPRRCNEISARLTATSSRGGRFDNLFTGIAVERPQSLDPNSRIGLEGIAHEDTYNGDYGRLPCANGGAR